MRVAVGTPCIVKESRQIMTVIGHVPEDSDDLTERDWRSFRYSDELHFKVMGLYYDPNTPERQEIIHSNITELTPVQDLDSADAICAGRASMFWDPKVAARTACTARTARVTFFHHFFCYYVDIHF